MPKTVTILPGQGLYDIAMQECGTIEAVLAIVNLNPGFDINTQLYGGQKIQCPDTYAAGNQAIQVLSTYARNGTHPATQSSGDTRITEDDEKRITEDNENRIVNA